MKRTANIYIRVEPEIKKRAEVIFDELGIPMSNAVGIFLKQVIVHGGFPFEIKIKEPLVHSNLTEEEIIKELEKAEVDFKNNRVNTLKEVVEKKKKNKINKI